MTRTATNSAVRAPPPVCRMARFSTTTPASTVPRSAGFCACCCSSARDYTREHGPAVGWILRLLLQHRALGFYDMPVGMPTLLRELRAAGVRMVGLASCSETAVEQMQVKYPWLGLLDGTMVSARECIAKPESALFERAIRAFHLDPAHTLFVENNAANTAAACELGLYAVRFESAEQIRALLLPVS